MRIILFISIPFTRFLRGNRKGRTIISSPHSGYDIIKKPVGDDLKTLRNSLSNSKAVKTTAWISLIIFPIFLILGAELLQYEQKKYVISLILERPLSILFGYLPLIMVFAALNLIIRRPAVVCFIVGFFILTMSVVSKMKLDIVGEYLYPWDFLMLKNGGEFKEFDIKFDLKIYMIIILSTWLLWCAFVWMAKIKIKLNILLSLTLAAGIILCLVFYIFNEPFRLHNYSSMGVKVTDVTNQQESYEKHGFVSGFVLNIGNSPMARPKTYNKQDAQAILEHYKIENGSFNVKPDIIIILSEAFWDIRLIPGNTFSENPLPNFDRIASEQIAGKFVAPTHGGGTVRTEFEILTGISYDNFQTGIVPYSGSVTENTWSYANHLKSLGYKTSAVHPYAKTFYNRNVAFPLMGIDSFMGQEEMKDAPLKGPYISDDYFADMIINKLKFAEKDGKPAFIFGISMGNHGLYENKYKSSEFDIKVSNDKLKPDELNIIQNYTQGVHNADKMLGKLYDFVKSRKRPTAILYFGDHQPSIGYDFSAYKQSGFLPADKAGIPAGYMEKMLTCPYAIITNYDTGKKYGYRNESVSAYLLTDLYMDYLNIPKNSYMNFLLDYAKQVPKNIPSKGILTEGVDKSVAQEFFSEHSLISYDILHGRYGDMGVKFK